MYLFIAQDFDGNVYVTDEKDSLPPDVVDFHEVWLAEKKSFYNCENPTLSLEIQDYSEIVSLKRG